MNLERFSLRTRMKGSAEAAYAWHMRRGAFERLTPPWEKVRLKSGSTKIAEGSEALLETSIGPVPIRWLARHQNIVPRHQFQDVQVSGPFATWEHTHRFTPDGPDAFWMEDSIDYALPLGSLGRWVGGSAVKAKLNRLFRYRHAVLAHDLKAHGRYPGTPLTVAISGSTGLVGSALMSYLETAGHRPISVRRHRTSDASNAPIWNPETGQADFSGVGALDAVVHLAAETIAQRWTPAAKNRIRQSRVEGTRLLCETLARLKHPPKVFVCASATGIYGNRGEEWLDESSGVGTGFLAEVAQAWEKSTRN